MGLLDRTPHIVTVQRRKRRVTPHGSSLVAFGAPVDVSCVVRALSASEAADLGLTTETVHRVVSREWPGDVLSLVTYNGAKWEPIGDPLWFDGSARTQHWEVRLKRVSPNGAGL
ncbi:hypothetical protein ACFWHR_03895 [Leucobacter sp. NPDC058333]|uniref:hypothetical protein n=1 Tax=Leucobacter sp. NPDC058333 TaxID=3346450 RepID=UPI003661F5DB